MVRERKRFSLMISVSVIFTLRVSVRERVRLNFMVSVSVMFTVRFKFSVIVSVIFQFFETGLGLVSWLG